MSKICKWGNSLGLRLPAPIAQVAGLKNGSLVSVRLLDNGAVLITPLNSVEVVKAQNVKVKTRAASSKW